MIKHVNIAVQGLVQGVLFRHTAQIEAEGLDIKGFAKNADDGSVYIEAEGEEENLKKFIDWCSTGPELASVHDIKVGSGKIKYFQTFETL